MKQLDMLRTAGKGICERIDKLAVATRSPLDQPHHVNPKLDTVRLVLATKNWSNIPGVCSVGLSVTAANTVRTLRRNGVHAEAWQVQDVTELYTRLDAAALERRPITHLVASASSWLQPLHYIELGHRYPNIEFVQLNHTGTAYLSIDKFGIKNIRATIDLERDLHNVRVAFNNPRGSAWADASFGGGKLLLPNLYDVTTFVEPSPPRANFDPLRVGSFGASRPWKNMLSAAEAAVIMARELGVSLELHVNAGRDENQWGGKRMIESRRELFDGLPGAKIVETLWSPWPQFRKLVRHMDILLAPSFDETFCVVVADGVAEGVPSVVTGAIEWAPKHWMADPWDPSNIAHVGIGLLHSRHPTHAGRAGLRQHVQRGVRLWIDYLLHNAPLE